MTDLARLLALNGIKIGYSNGSISPKQWQEEHQEEYDLLYEKLLNSIEQGQKYKDLMTHTKYHNTFGCKFHFDLKESKKEVNDLKRKNYYLEQNQKTLEDIELIEKGKDFNDAVEWRNKWQNKMYEFEKLEQQNKALTEQVKQLQEESYSRLLRLNERNQEIQNLKEQIEEIKSCQFMTRCFSCGMSGVPKTREDKECGNCNSLRTEIVIRESTIKEILGDTHG